MYFWLADRFSEGPGVLELAVAAVSGGHSPASASHIELLVALAYAETEGERAEGTVAFGAAISGDDERAAILAEDADARLRELGDHWAAGVRTRLDEHAVEALEKAEEIAHQPFRLAGLLLDAWVAERRGECARAVSEYSAALALAYESSGAHESSLVAARTARALWSSPDARAELIGARRTLGDTETARALHARLVDWATQARPQQPRETFLAALDGSPAATALSMAVEVPG